MDLDALNFTLNEGNVEYYFYCEDGAPGLCMNRNDIDYLQPVFWNK